jgi:hypothetical protein
VKLRDLPSVDELLRDERLAAEPHDLVVAAARTVLTRARVEQDARDEVEEAVRFARESPFPPPALTSELVYA